MANVLEKFFENNNNYKIYNKIAYGRTNDIFFNVRLVNYNCHARIAAFIKNPNGINISAINLFLQENKKKYKASKATVENDVIYVMLTSATRVKADTVKDFLNAFSEYLIENGYTSSCMFCSNNENIGYTFTNDQVREVCPECHEKLSGVVEDMKEERQASGSYLKGAIGAVIGGILGIIPWVLLGMLGYIAALSGLAMAFLSYKGYMLMKGKVGKGMIWILIVVLLVFTYAGVLISLGVSIAQEYGLSFADIDLGAFIISMLGAPFDSYSFNTGVVWGQIALGWIFAGLGSFGILRKAGKESSSKDLLVKRINNDIE